MEAGLRAAPDGHTLVVVDEAAQFLAEETQKWGRAVRASGATAD